MQIRRSRSASWSAAEHLPRALAEKVRASEPSLGTFTIFLGMRRDLRRHGLGRSNLWLYPTWDIEALYGPALAGIVGERYGLLLSPNAQKDDSGRLAPDGCSTLEITTVMPFAAFRPFLGSPPGERGPAYAALKATIADRMLAVVDSMAPGLIGDVVVREYATPLTSREYVGAVGEAGEIELQKDLPSHYIIYEGYFTDDKFEGNWEIPLYDPDMEYENIYDYEHVDGSGSWWMKRNE